jgi:hypothetical protein
MKMNNKNAQLMIVNIIMFVMIIVLGAVLTPVISTFMNTAINDTNATGAGLLLMQSVVPVFWIGIIMLFFVMIGSGRQQQSY